MSIPASMPKTRDELERENRELRKILNNLPHRKDCGDARCSELRKCQWPERCPRPS